MMADWLRQPPQSLFLPVVLPIYQHFMQNGFFADWKRDTLYGQIHSMECRCIFHIKTLAL